MTDTPEPDAAPESTGHAADARERMAIPAFESAKDLAAFLREHGGFSRREAAGIVAEARTLLVREEATRREAESAQASSAAILAALQRRAAMLRP